ncbi:MAG: hypothetical protein GOV00_04105 [Candidatus Altiarchaeota archaeon]|nr:hypothetical protein [Candidatus Altiarchaeota archaeon]
MRRGMSDNIWIFVGVIMLLLIMASFSPTSTFGKAFIGLRSSLGGMFGANASYCPFINPYAMTIFSAGELRIAGEHPLCDPTEYALQKKGVDALAAVGDVDPAGNDECNFDDYTIRINEENGELTVSWMNKSDMLQTEVFTQDKFFGYLTDYQADNDLSDTLGGDNKVAIQLISQRMPSWQCLLIYGILPFFIVFNILKDVLSFAFFRAATRNLIASFGSLIAVMTGALSNVIVAIGSFVGITVGQSFLLAILGLALVSVFLGQITITAGATKSSLDAVKGAMDSAMAIAAAGKGLQLGKDQEKR